MSIVNNRYDFIHIFYLTCQAKISLPGFQGMPALNFTSAVIRSNILCLPLIQIISSIITKMQLWLSISCHLLWTGMTIIIAPYDIKCKAGV